MKLLIIYTRRSVDKLKTTLIKITQEQYDKNKDDLVFSNILYFCWLNNIKFVDLLFFLNIFINYQ